MNREELCSEIYAEYKSMCASCTCEKCKYWSSQRNCVVDFVLAYLKKYDMLKEGVLDEKVNSKI